MLVSRDRDAPAVQYAGSEKFCDSQCFPSPAAAGDGIHRARTALVVSDLREQDRDALAAQLLPHGTALAGVLVSRGRNAQVAVRALAAIEAVYTTCFCYSPALILPMPLLQTRIFQRQRLQPDLLGFLRCQMQASNFHATFSDDGSLAILRYMLH